MIISLGYRIKSKIATHFRRWATERLKEYMIKGFTMDDERLSGQEVLKIKKLKHWKYVDTSFLFYKNKKERVIKND